MEEKAKGRIVKLSQESLDVVSAARMLFGSSASETVNAALALYDRTHQVRERIAQRFVSQKNA